MRIPKEYGIPMFAAIVLVGFIMWASHKANEIGTATISELPSVVEYKNCCLPEDPICEDKETQMQNVMTIHDTITKTVTDTVFVHSKPETVVITETLPAPEDKYIHITGCCYPSLRTLSDGEVVYDGSFKMCSPRTTQKSHYASNFPMVWRNLKNMWRE